MTDRNPKLRWYRLTPDRFVIALLVVECLLWLSERFQWFPFNLHKGWTVLITVAAVGFAFLVVLVWFIASLLFRSRFQFGIRSLLVLVVVVAIPFSWLAVEMKAAKMQWEVVGEIEKGGCGIVQYDYEFDASDEYMPGGEPPGPSWLRNLLGDDFLSHVRHVGRGPGSDATWAHFKELPQLSELNLNYTNVTDAELEHLRGLPHLQRLYLDGTRVTDAGLKHLNGLTQLRELNLGSTQITDVGLEYLKGLIQLEQLDLRVTHVTNEGVKKLQQALPKCKIEHWT